MVLEILGRLVFKVILDQLDYGESSVLLVLLAQLDQLVIMEIQEKRGREEEDRLVQLDYKE
jgi:hypothetical protein